jgi:hypothetical protein
MVRCINPNPKKPKIKDGNDLWELIKPEFELDIKELLDEIQVNKPNTLKSLVTSYTKYLESISRAEMFDESGNYNFTEEDLDYCWKHHKSYLIDIQVDVLLCLVY